MNKLTLSLATFAVLSVGSLLSTGAEAAIWRNIDTAIDAVSQVEAAGCYRWGETGYHRYRFCAGPYWLYPHHRYCHYGYCYYR